MGESDEALRVALLAFIADFSNWDNSASPVFLETARGLVRAAYPDGPPLVVDPFAGGGWIPLEALRLSCEAFASDLNPVACPILKVLLEEIPRHGPEPAEELRRVGSEIRRQAEKELAEFYPKDPEGPTPIAYLWARTVKCESPNCGAEIPLARSFRLCKKLTRRRALRYRVERPKGEPPRVEFVEIFEPKSDDQVPPGPVARARATCVCCGAVLPPERVRAQLAAQPGAADRGQRPRRAEGGCGRGGRETEYPHLPPGRRRLATRGQSAGDTGDRGRGQGLEDGASGQDPGARGCRLGGKPAMALRTGSRVVGKGASSGCVACALLFVP